MTEARTGVRPLTDREHRNAAALRACVGDIALLQPTHTGLSKSILDAIAPLRYYLRAGGFHDFTRQGQGPEHKEVRPAAVLSIGAITDTTVSLYRPNTKQGDPRIWISGLPKHVSADDVLALFLHEECLYVVNLTRHDIADVVDASGEISRDSHGRADLELISQVRADESAPARDLLNRLRKLAGSGWLPAVGHGDTAVGRTIEDALGIKMNSRRTPDFRGIEIKAARAHKVENRQTLFAKTPDWKASQLRSSAEILGRFGYERDGEFKLYCQLDGGKPNSQGIGLIVDELDDVLHAADFNDGRASFARWNLETLRSRLATKHRETFWITAKSRADDAGRESFMLVEAKHTNAPFVSQFGTLVMARKLSVDFLIKRLPSGSAKDKGYLFKLSRDSFGDLFPPPVTYDLGK